MLSSLLQLLYNRVPLLARFGDFRRQRRGTPIGNFRACMRQVYKRRRPLLRETSELRLSTGRTPNISSDAAAVCAVMPSDYLTETSSAIGERRG